MASLTLHDHDGSSGASDQDTLAPLPHAGVAPWPLTFPYQYPIPHPYNPHPVHDPTYSFTAGGGSAGSPHSEGETASYLGAWGKNTTEIYKNAPQIQNKGTSNASIQLNLLHGFLQR